ncbi:MAG: HAD-IB family hydrolase [Acidimicrobiales bacterium]
MTSAAIFDLDRTLLRGGSGPVLQHALREEGLGPQQDVPGLGALFGLFEVIGETYPSMLVAKRAVSMTKGWPVDAVDRAAAAAAPELFAKVLPYAKQVIEQHRGEGRKLVLATTTPEHLVRPLAELLNFDAVVASKHAQLNGEFLGELDGDFVWGRAKARAVKRWLKDQGISLRSSYAYSDSYYDVPLLARVGHPVAVNPDIRLEALARLRGWEVRWFDVPPGVAKLGGQIEAQKLALSLSVPELLPFAKLEFTGVEKIPAKGAAVLVANHRSYFDATAVAMLAGKSGRVVRFLGKKEVFDAPFVGDLAKAFGGIRVDRGTGSGAPLEAAERALEAGELIVMMPQGTIPRGPAFFDPELKARLGAARLAGAAGVPVVPVGLWGTEQVWPRSARFPNLNPLQRPTVQIKVGDPFMISGDDPDTDTKAIMAAISAQLPAEAAVQREPSEAELRATFPPGYKGDPTAEVDRRPGSDT